MWLKSIKEDRYFNLDKCLRYYRDGANGWAFLQDDGTAIHVTDSDMEMAKRFIDPEKILRTTTTAIKSMTSPSRTRNSFLYQFEGVVNVLSELLVADIVEPYVLIIV